MGWENGWVAKPLPNMCGAMDSIPAPWDVDRQIYVNAQTRAFDEMIILKWPDIV